VPGQPGSPAKGGPPGPAGVGRPGGQAGRLVGPGRRRPLAHAGRAEEVGRVRHLGVEVDQEVSRQRVGPGAADPADLAEPGFQELLPAPGPPGQVEA
jgi:hypothetical protein